MSGSSRGWSAVPPAAQRLPVTPPPRDLRSAVARGLLIALALVVMAGCGLLVVLMIGADTGPIGLVAGFVFALIPVAVVAPALLWLDRLEAEPVGQLLFAFGWGALVATFIALLVNSYSLALLTDAGGDVSTTAVFIAPWVEEISKGAVVLVLVLWRRREFDGIIDGIVYAGLSGLGFAFTENVLYLGRSLQENGTAGLVTTFVLRAVFGPFAHPLFAMAIGIGFGVAVRSRYTTVKIIAPLTGLLVAVVLHGLWNLSAVTGLRGFIGVYIAVQVPIFLLAVGFAVWARRREGQVIRRHLQPYVASGWFTDAEVAMLGSARERRAARQWAAAVAGPPGRASMRGFQTSATDLAFARDRATRAALHRQEVAVESEALRRATAHRHGFAAVETARSPQGDRY
ncbi:MAG: PrsW family intramembrane metalloprotease [Angustibacter sp.]